MTRGTRILNEIVFTISASGSRADKPRQLSKVVREKVVVLVRLHDLGMALAKKREGTPDCANVHRLPQPV